MSDFDKGFITTASVNPISWVYWTEGHWLVYIAGVRSGSLIAGEATALYRSVAGGSRMFGSLADAVGELERIANWIVVANAEVCNKQAVYA